MFITTPTEYFTVKSGQVMDLAPVIAENFMCYKFFLHFTSQCRRQSKRIEGALAKVGGGTKLN